ncbi:MAG: hypothetical protein O2967_11770 [Proteobacteria bacterium]|nr:hypothetical protein [Pseudomonadota bacterium]
MTSPSGSATRPRHWRWFRIAGRLLWLELVGGYALIGLYIFIQRLEGANPGADFINLLRGIFARPGRRSGGDF